MRALLMIFWRGETALALALGWLLVFAVPFRHSAALVGKAKGPAEAGELPPEKTLQRARAVSRRIVCWAPKMPFRTTCLVRAMAGWLLLKRRGIASTIRFGVAMEDGKLAAHAWLLLADETLLGGAEATGYQPLADLGEQRG